MADYIFQVDDKFGKTSMVPLDRFPFTIGRGPENNLVISEPSVSRQHAYVKKMPEGLSIVDNESRNGIFVNNQKVFKVRLLNLGDTLRIGSAKLKLDYANNPEIPLVSRASETIQYIPSRDTWDPVKSLAAGLPGAGQVGMPQRGRRSPNWQNMLPRLFVQGPISEIYEQILNMIEETISFDRCFIILFDKGNPDQSQ